MCKLNEKKNKNNLFNAKLNNACDNIITNLVKLFSACLFNNTKKKWWIHRVNVLNNAAMTSGAHLIEFNFWARKSLDFFPFNFCKKKILFFYPHRLESYFIILIIFLSKNSKATLIDSITYSIEHRIYIIRLLTFLIGMCFVIFFFFSLLKFVSLTF